MTVFVKRTVGAIPIAILAVLCLLVVAAAPAAASGTQRGTTKTFTIRLTALPVANLCNGDAVAVSGDLKITVTTTPRRDGGYTVRSTAAAWRLTGNRVFPEPPIGYNAADVEQSNTYYAPPPSPAWSTYDVHWTKLVPQGPAPTMYLVIVTRLTVLSDGSTLMTPEPVRTYLVCTEPCRQSGA